MIGKSLGMSSGGGVGEVETVGLHFQDNTQFYYYIQ